MMASRPTAQNIPQNQVIKEPTNEPIEHGNDPEASILINDNTDIDNGVITVEPPAAKHFKLGFSATAPDTIDQQRLAEAANAFERVIRKIGSDVHMVLFSTRGDPPMTEIIDHLRNVDHSLTDHITGLRTLMADHSKPLEVIARRILLNFAQRMVELAPFGVSITWENKPSSYQYLHEKLQKEPFGGGILEGRFGTTIQKEAISIQRAY